MKFIYRLIVIVAFLIGVVVGRTNAYKLNSKTTTMEIASKTKDVSKVEILADVKKDAVVVKQMTRKEISYYPSGKIQRIVLIGKNSDLKTTDTSNIQSLTQNVKLEDVTKKSSQLEEYETNWLAGIAWTPHLFEINFNPNESTMQLGYRVLGNVYVTGASNLTFKNFSVGLLLTF